MIVRHKKQLLSPVAMGDTIGKLPECHIQKNYIMKEDDIIQVCSTSIILLIFLSDIFSSVYVLLFIIHHFV